MKELAITAIAAIAVFAFMMVLVFVMNAGLMKIYNIRINTDAAYTGACILCAGFLAGRGSKE